MRSVIAIVGLTCACVLAGCGPKPADVCSDPNTRDQVFALVFSAAETTVQSMNQGIDDVSRVYADTMIPRDAVLTELANMRKEHLLGFNLVTLEGVDKQTGRISCSADVQLTTATQDRTAAAKDAMQRAAQSLNINDLTPPLGLSAGSSHAGMDYWREPNSGGRFKWVFTAQDDVQLVSALVLIASERAILHSPKAFRVPASDWQRFSGSVAPEDTPAAENTPAD